MKKLLIKTLLLAGLVATVAACNSGSAGSGSKSEIKCETTDIPGEIGGIYTAGDYLIDSRGHVCVSITRNDSVPKVDMVEVGGHKYEEKKYVCKLVLEALDEQGNVIDEDEYDGEGLLEIKPSDSYLCKFSIKGHLAKTKSFRLKTVLSENEYLKNADEYERFDAEQRERAGHSYGDSIEVDSVVYDSIW